jgi:hypothetical protein
MRHRVVLALLAVLLLAGCTITRGSGQLSSESRQVSGFTKVELSGSGELKIEQTGTESLTISAEDNVLPRSPARYPTTPGPAGSRLNN